MLYTSATSASTISLPKAQWKSKTRNLLPDDKHFNSRQLLRLFLKPKARMGSRRAGRRTQLQPTTEPLQREVDEAYWANRENDDPAADEDGAVEGNYDANFFQDDGLPMPGGVLDDDDDFADAREHFSPPPTDAPEGTQGAKNIFPGSQADAFGAQLVTQSRRFRPEYVQYARVAKKVDVKRLKDELWKGIGFEGVSSSTLYSQAAN
jgi:condensin complex subunit 2